ncbi:hypothetical protein [Butyrivibrio sp. MC2021]|uniref:hypothetical protein n=1 Tax=Butyrivibrio sp. MC2021 TaxID=1408306 RepID=UPI0012DF8582|nr:hypothetical protein [Butyrivibrio sp. MC2021]
MDLVKLGLEKVCKLYEVDMTGDYNIRTVPARSLISPLRLDLLAKIAYVESREKNRNREFALGIYKRTLEACTLGTFSEFDNDKKQNFDDFVTEFDKLIDSIKEKGMDSSISVIPVGKNGIIMNGAHRVAIAAYFDMEVPIVEFDVDGAEMGVELFKKRYLQENDIDYLVTELCKWRDDLYLCCLWPSAGPEDKRRRAKEIMSSQYRVVYEKKVNLNSNGMHHLIPQIYCTMSWIGDVDTRFFSATPKVNNCLGDNPFEVILFQGDELQKVVALKKAMRDVFGIEENSLHITDYPEETRYVAQMLYSNNTVDFLNKGEPFKYIKLNKKVFAFKDYLKESNRDIDDYVIDSGSVLGIYGIREANDLDYLCITEKQGDDTEEFENHVYIKDGEYYKRPFDDLIYNPFNVFYYFGLKIMTLDRVDEFKKNRASSKDKIDTELIASFISGKKSLSQKLGVIRLNVSRGIRNGVYKTASHLPDPVYDLVRKVYRLLKHKK